MFKIPSLGGIEQPSNQSPNILQMWRSSDSAPDEGLRHRLVQNPHRCSSPPVNHTRCSATGRQPRTFKLLHLNQQLVPSQEWETHPFRTGDHGLRAGGQRSEVTSLKQTRLLGLVLFLDNNFLFITYKHKENDEITIMMIIII